MVETNPGEESPLRILHVLRAPIGGLWRHVVDVAREQVSRGHLVGIIADAHTGGARAKATLQDLLPTLALGVSRVPMRRNPHPSDLLALAHVTGRIFRARPDVVHGHGSKGGALARLALQAPGRPRAVRAYTPHGGSLNYRPGSRIHAIYMQVEAALQRRTDLVLFESGFVAARYGRDVGSLPRFHRIVHNGIAAAEFAPVGARESARDFVYVGELRAAKGIDTLLAALARAGQFRRTLPTLTLVGSGPDRTQLEVLAAKLGLLEQVEFRESMAAREAFTFGRTLVVPSRAESLPYVVLEAAGAGIPIVATNVGGIPEIFGPMRRRLLEPDNVAALSERLVEMLDLPASHRVAEAQSLATYVRQHFSIGQMIDGILSSYREVRAARGAGHNVEPGARHPGTLTPVT